MNSELQINNNLIYEPSPDTGTLRQGEIICNLIDTQIDIKSINSSELFINEAKHPYAIVISQDCDLTWDFEARQQGSYIHRLLPNILFCEVIEAEKLRGLGSQAGINSKAWDNIIKNKNEKYHFLQQVSPDKDILRQGLPELGVDFTRYFAIPTIEVYERLKLNQIKRRCRLKSPYLEHFSTRFAYYQFRVALPIDHLSK